MYMQSVLHYRNKKKYQVQFLPLRVLEIFKGDNEDSGIWDLTLW